MKSSLFIEFGGKKTDEKSLIKTAKEVWAQSGKMVKELTSMELYLKPDESKCYYVFNGKINGSFDV